MVSWTAYYYSLYLTTCVKRPSCVHILIYQALFSLGCMFGLQQSIRQIRAAVGSAHQLITRCDAKKPKWWTHFAGLPLDNIHFTSFFFFSFLATSETGPFISVLFETGSLSDNTSVRRKRIDRSITSMLSVPFWRRKYETPWIEE